MTGLGVVEGGWGSVAAAYLATAAIFAVYGLSLWLRAREEAGR